MVSFLKEILSWKTLISQLVIKNLKLRYHSTKFAIFWSFLSPLFIASIYFFVFSILFRLQIKGVPFFLFIICGIFPWQFFQLSISQAATSLFENKNLIRESQFPHFIIPLSVVLSNGIVFLPNLLLLLLVAVIFLKGVSFYFLLLPFALLFYFLMTFGAAIFVSIFFLRSRNLPHYLEVALTFLFYWTPIVYPLFIAKEYFTKSFWIFYVTNPFLGFISLFRLSLLKGFSVPLEGGLFIFSLFLTPLIFSCVVLYLAKLYYQKNRVWLNDYLSY